MAGNDSSWKWILGCGGVACLLLLLACGGIFYSMSNAFVGVKDMVVAEIDRTNFAANWQPPADDAPAEAILPEQVGDFQLNSREASPKSAEFGINQAGRHAEYSSPAMTVDVFVFKANPMEKEAIFDQVGTAIDDGDYNFRTQITTMNGDRLSFSVAPPATQGLLWASKGWLFLFLTSGESELEPFQEAYLTQIEGASAVETPSDETNASDGEPVEDSSDESVDAPTAGEQEAATTPGN